MLFLYTLLNWFFNVVVPSGWRLTASLKKGKKKKKYYITQWFRRDRNEVVLEHSKYHISSKMEWVPLRLETIFSISGQKITLKSA